MKRPPLGRMDLPLYDMMQNAIAAMLEEAQAGFPNLPDDPEMALRILVQISRNLEAEQCVQQIRLKSMTNGIKLTKQMLRSECTTDVLERATREKVPETDA
jgi:hypothetical protein